MVLATRGSSAIVVLGLMAKCKLWPFNTDLDPIYSESKGIDFILDSCPGRCCHGSSRVEFNGPSYEGISSLELNME